MTKRYYLDALTVADCETARAWRNSAYVRPSLRTTRLLTADEQAAFYHEVVCDRHAPHRYWAVRERLPPDGTASAFVAMVGLTHISWENGHAELSLLAAPGAFDAMLQAVLRLLLLEAFHRLGLRTVFAECYDCSPYAAFWASTVPAKQQVRLARRKRWRGALHDSTVLWFTADDIPPQEPDPENPDTTTKGPSRYVG